MWFRKKDENEDEMESTRIRMMNKNMSDSYQEYEDFDEDDIHEDDYHDYMTKKVSKIDEDDVLQLLDNEEEIIQKLRHAAPLRKFITVGQVMFAMVRDSLLGRYPNTPWLTIATSALILLYVLNPMDFIPDFIPFIGYLDDLVIMTIGLGWIETDLHRYLDWRIEDAVQQLGEN